MTHFIAIPILAAGLVTSSITSTAQSLSLDSARRTPCTQVAWATYWLGNSAEYLADITTPRDARRRIRRFITRQEHTYGLMAQHQTQIIVPRDTKRVFVNGAKIPREFPKRSCATLNHIPTF